MKKFIVLIGLLSLPPGICSAQGIYGTGQQADAETMKLLQMMDKDRNGLVSRREFMDFMAAEFDRLDVNKSGALDVGDLTAIKVSSKHVGGTGSR